MSILTDLFKPLTDYLKKVDWKAAAESTTVKPIIISFLASVLTVVFHVSADKVDGLVQQIFNLLTYFLPVVAASAAPAAFMGRARAVNSLFKPVEVAVPAKKKATRKSKK